MNIPNKLTVFRIALVPLIVFFLIFENINHKYLYSLVIFIIASITDRLDGRIARKINQVTNFGAIMDPLADKILVSSIFICFNSLGLVHVSAVVLIISREFIITSLRFLILKNEHKIISANVWGKLKTVSQMMAIITVLAFQVYTETVGMPLLNFNIFAAIQNTLVWACVLLSVVSGIVYILDNRRHIHTN